MGATRVSQCRVGWNHSRREIRDDDDGDTGAYARDARARAIRRGSAHFGPSSTRAAPCSRELTARKRFEIDASIGDA